MESKFNFKNFSIVIPIYNEEEILEESTNAIFSLCKRMEIDFEIIFSENGSTDKTKAIAEELTNKHSEIKIISNPEPNYGNALKTGFKIAKNDLVISFDIDYYSESFLSEALKLESEYSGITASKRLGSSEDGRRFIRRLATNFFVILLKTLFGTKLSDTHGMKAIRKLNIQKDNEILTICMGGVRSQAAAELLTKENYKCVNVSDGFLGNPENLGWKNSDLPCK